MSTPLDSKIKISKNIPLSRFSTLQIGGPARYFSEPTDREQLPALIDFCNQESIPLLVIGRGSNLLFSDEGFPGLVVSLGKFEIERSHIDANHTLRVSAGLSLFRIATICRESALSGLEFICHIPGTVGGAIVMNAGFGRPEKPYREVKDVLQSFSLLGSDGKLYILTPNDVDFGYRTSRIPEGIIIDATFQLSPSNAEKIRREIKQNFSYRNSVQDLRYPSAGSMFKNPPGGHGTAGQLIDQAGLKGTKIGGAMISERHGNFFLNVEHAKAADMLALIQLAKKRVYEQFGVELEPEVKIISPEFHSSTIETTILA